MDETLIKNSSLDYKPDYLDDGEPELLFDAYGNPTPALLEALYESKYGMVDIMTLDEFKAELDGSDKIA